MAEIKKYKSWLTESEGETKYLPSEEELKSLNSSNKVLKSLIASKLSAGLETHGGHGRNPIRAKVVLETESLKEYSKILDDIDIEMVPDYFNHDKITLYYSEDDSLNQGKFEIAHPVGAPGHTISKNSIRINYKAENFKQFKDIVDNSLDELVKDLKTIRIMVQLTKKDIPNDLKTVVKNKAKENYRNVVDKFFYNGEKPDLEDVGIGEMIADVYASNKSILDTIAEIENEDILDAIIKSLEKMDENDLIKVLKSYLKSTRIIKGI